MMNWLQKNTYIVLLFAAFSAMGAFVAFTDQEEASYENIQVAEGDTLWTLAEQYRGTMTTQEWVDQVKRENGLAGETIVAGHAISVPIHENSVHIANLEDEEELHSVEVAIKNQ